MTRNAGGSRAKAGFYWNPAEWEMVTVPEGGGVLPGGPAQRYRRIPTAGMLLLAPAMGAAFVVFLPLIGFGLVLKHFGGRALRRVGLRAPQPVKSGSRRGATRT